MNRRESGPAVVVGIDGSKAALQAALWAIDEATDRDVPLRLVGSSMRCAPPAPAVSGAPGCPRSGRYDACRTVHALGKQVDIETAILWGSRSPS